MTNKFDDVPTDKGTIIIYRHEAEFNGYDVLCELWASIGNTGKSFIYANEDIKDLSEKELEENVKSIPDISEDTELTIKRSDLPYTFVYYQVRKWDAKTIKLTKDQKIAVRRLNQQAIIRGPEFRTCLDLALDSKGKIRKLAASCTTAPPEILDFLSRDKTSLVRGIVAVNKNTSMETLQLLLGDEDAQIRSALIFSHYQRLSEKNLISFAYDSDKSVRNTAAQILQRQPSPAGIQTLEFLSRDKEAEVRSRVASCEHISIETYIKLAADVDPIVRRNVAFTTGSISDPRLVEMMELLSKDEDDEVRLRVCWNVNTSDKTLIALSTDNNATVCAEALRVL